MKRKELLKSLPYFLWHLHGALHMGTENGFTGSGSPIWIQCGLALTPHGMQTARIALLDSGSHALYQSTVTQHNKQLGSGSRPCGSKVVFGSRSLIHIRSGSKFPCEKPPCLDDACGVIVHSRVCCFLSASQSPAKLINENLNCHPKYFGVYFSSWNHQICFKMVYCSPKKPLISTMLITHNPFGWL